MENENNNFPVMKEGVFFSFDWTEPAFETAIGIRFVLKRGQEELAHRLLNDPTLYNIGTMLAELVGATEKRIPVQVVYKDGPKA